MLLVLKHQQVVHLNIAFDKLIIPFHFHLEILGIQQITLSECNQMTTYRLPMCKEFLVWFLELCKINFKCTYKVFHLKSNLNQDQWLISFLHHLRLCHDTKYFQASGRNGPHFPISCISKLQAFALRNSWWFSLEVHQSCRVRSTHKD